MKDPARVRWKVVRRLIRVVRRENRKALRDCALFGSGVVFFPNDGSDPRHIPIEQVRLEAVNAQP